MGIPDHLTCLLRNLYAGQAATVRTGHGTTDWFKIGKGVGQGCMLSKVCTFWLLHLLSTTHSCLWQSPTVLRIAELFVFCFSFFFCLLFFLVLHEVRSYGKKRESACNARDPGLIPGLGRSPGEGNGNPLVFLPGEFHGQRSLAGYSRGLAKSWTRLSD